MPVQILMPALSPTMKEGTVAKWLKGEGDKVEPGDIIAEIETDKAIMEFEYVDEPGTLHKILAKEGSKNVPINKPIAVVGLEGDTAECLENLCNNYESPKESPKDSCSQDTRDVAPTKGPQSSSALHSEEIARLTTNEDYKKRVKASPLAKKLASKLALNIESIKGSGPYGRVVKADVLLAAENCDEARKAHYKVAADSIEISGMRRVIADRLVQSKRDVPHFYLSMDCSVGELLSLRSKINGGLESSGIKITVNDFIIKAVALSMRDFPQINASWAGDKILLHKSVDVSFAVSLDDGLITPIIRAADEMSLTEISSTAKVLATRAKERNLSPEEFQGGGFTISNMGMFGIKEFYAIINPPQSCIMAVGGAEKRAVVQNDCIVAEDLMTVTLSVDHRIVDGVLAAKFFNKFKFYIENPLAMLV